MKTLTTRHTLRALACLTAFGLAAAPTHAGLYGVVNDFDTAGPTQSPYTVGTNGYLPAEIAGPATGDYLQLTDGGGGQATRALFEAVGAASKTGRFGPAPVVLVDFDFRAQGSAGQADGLYLALFRAADVSGSGPQYNEEPNIITAGGNNLAVGLDIYNNTEPGGNNHVSLHYGSQVGANVVPSFDISTDVFNHAQLRVEFLADGSGANVSMTLQNNALGMNATNSSAPETVFNNVFVAGLTPYDFQVGVGARTGGETALQQIDNLNVKVGTSAFAYGADFRGANSDFTLIQNAAFVTDNGDNSYQEVLRLTSNGGDQKGTAWLTEKQSVAGGFTTDFQFRFSHHNGGADGLAFFVQNAGLGEHPGEGGIANNALGIAFDSYGTGSDYEHLRIFDGGTLIADVDLAPLGFDFDANPAFDPYAGRYDVRIDYLPGNLDVWLNGILVVDNLDVDLMSMLNGSAVDANGLAWLGFSARTGGAAENHDVINWHFASFAAPAPAALPAGLALMGLVATRRRRTA